MTIQRYNKAKLDIVDWWRNGKGDSYPVVEATVPVDFIITDEDATKGIKNSISLCMLARAICRTFGWNPDDGERIARELGLQINWNVAHVPTPDKRHGVVIYRYLLPSWIQKWDGDKGLIGHKITLRPPSYSMRLLARRADSAFRRAEANGKTNGKTGKNGKKKLKTRASPTWAMRQHKGWRAVGHAY